MFKQMDIIQDMNVCLGLARGVSPYKTGNVRFNAITSYRTDDGFAIKYSLANAYYIYFLEEGTRFTTRHQGFIANKTVPLLSEYMYTKYTIKDKVGEIEFAVKSDIANIDVLKGARSKKLLGLLQARQEAQLDSRYADMVNYGHMSNEFSWKHNQNYEMPTPDKFAKR